MSFVDTYYPHFVILVQFGYVFLKTMHKSVLIKFKLGRRITGILSQVAF